MSHGISNSERFLRHICCLLQEVSSANALARQCLEAVELSEVLLHPGGELPTFHTLQIYRTRALLQGARGGVAGYDLLLPALEREHGASVRLLSITTGQGTFLLFMCPGARRLIGLLRTSHLFKDFLSADILHERFGFVPSALSAIPEAVA